MYFTIIDHDRSIMINSDKDINQEKGTNLVNKNIKIKQQGKFLKFLLYGRSFLPLLSAHHPECEKFSKSHTINLGKVRFCIGCFVGYPAAFIALYLINILKLTSSILYPFFFITSIIFLATFILSPLKLTKNKKIKITQKIFIGIGAALLYSWIVGLPNPARTNSSIAFIVLYLLISILNVYHALGFLNACYTCETPFDWGRCPGFKSIRNNMEKYGLLNFLIDLEDFSYKLIERREKKENKKKNLKKTV